jgi:hypothetical protein
MLTVIDILELRGRHNYRWHGRQDILYIHVRLLIKREVLEEVIQVIDNPLAVQALYSVNDPGIAMVVL